MTLLTTYTYHFMANRWGKCGNSSDFIFLDSKITVDGDCSHKIKRHLLLGRKAMTNLDCILKSRDNTLLTKVHLVIFWCWSWKSNTLTTWRKELTHLKDPDAGKDWRQEEKGTTENEMVGWNHRLKWTWVWVNSRSWWWTRRPGMLQPMGLQRVRHIWVTELNWTDGTRCHFLSFLNVEL